MQIKPFIEQLQTLGIEDFIGVPDSTLQVFCDYLNTNISNDNHFVTVNEGAAVGLGAGIYLAKKKPSCIYMQNSGIGNAVNPIASLLNDKVYAIPMLFLIGYRGEPGCKDEPQHKFQGEITISQLAVLDIPYAILSKNTTLEELQAIIHKATLAFSEHKQYAIVIKKDTFEKEEKAFEFQNSFTIHREDAIQHILKNTTNKDLIVSTTGKISREVYEQSNSLFHHHDNVFLTVGSMGHASMIALGIAKKMPQKRVFCIDGDGAALMHMGSMAFLAQQKTKNLVHIILNNNAHESVGGMPTNCQHVALSQIAKACGYTHCQTLHSLEEVDQVLQTLPYGKETICLEIKVALGSRADLGRPKESAIQNKEAFMNYIESEEN